MVRGQERRKAKERQEKGKTGGRSRGKGVEFVRLAKIPAGAHDTNLQ